MSGTTDQTVFSTFSAGSLGTSLTRILLAEEIQPGSPPSYQLCKDIFLSHPLGGKMAETPINMAQSQRREIKVPVLGEERIVQAFQREWKATGISGADQIIKNTVVLSKVYGIASVAVGNRGGDQSKALDVENIADLDLYFNVLDPLNTAGSLVMDQNPNSPDFMKPVSITAGGKAWHPSRTCVVMNEQPIYIEFTQSSYGFVGRSVYQRALFPMKTFLQSMITDQYVTVKCGLLIAKIKAAGSMINNRMMQMFGFKREQLKSGITGNVLSIGDTDSIESLDFQNLEGAARMAREHALKNVATAAAMPAKILDQETLVSGFGEGSEDAKQIARYIDSVRIEMDPIYRFFDNIVMGRAWSEAFYRTLWKDYPEYKKVPYLTALMDWRNAFEAIWPNLLAEPDSEKAKVQDVQFKASIATVEVLAPLLGPINRANLARWMAEQIGERKQLFSSPLFLDDDELDNPPAPIAATEGDDVHEPEPVAFSGRT